MSSVSGTQSVSPPVHDEARADAGLSCEAASIDEAAPWLADLHVQVLNLEAHSLDLQPAVSLIASALTRAGFEPERISIAILTQHPGLSGLGYVWTRVEGEVEFLERPPGFLSTHEHRVSPLHWVMTTRTALFVDAAGIQAEERFPIVQSFRDAGATSYLALPIATARGDVHVLGMWTRRAQGWTQSDVAQLGRTVPMLRLLIEVTEGRRLLGMIGMTHELTQRAMAEQALRNADQMMRQQSLDMARLEIERQSRLEIERQLKERSKDLADRNQALNALAASLEEKVAARTQELERALAHANSATQAKGRFLAMMSHEIRTPMHAVLGLGELLARTPLNETQAGLITTMQGTGEALMSILNGILDFSKIEADRIELDLVTLDPVRVMEDVVALLKGKALERNVSFALQIANDVPRAVRADVTRVRQIWINLIDNALKFTASGSVLLSLSQIKHDGRTVILRGSVQDTGVGIAPDAIKQIFEPFAQADASTARRFGGTGLGLAICKGLVEQMGGAIQVTSTLGEGTTFTFDLHLELAASPESIEQLPAVDSSEDLAGLRVLVVDDNPLNRMLMERQLAMLGAPSPAMAESGLQALAMVLEAPFDVVLMDMQMPDLDGLETTRRLRELQIPVQPWVIGVTANAFVDDRLACLDAGMDDFLSKPVSMTTLNASLRSVSRQSGTSSPN